MARKIWPFLLFLVGCSVLPVPIDLLPYLGAKRSGSQSMSVAPGSYALNIKLPDAGGYAASFEEANIPVTVGYASLDYSLEGTLQGVSVSGTLTAQVYLAPYDAPDPFQPAYKLGDPVTVPVTTGRTINLSGTATLNNAQLSALNAKRLRMGVWVTGMVDVQAAGTLTLNYTITRATLKVGAF